MNIKLPKNQGNQRASKAMLDFIKTIDLSIKEEDLEEIKVMEAWSIKSLKSSYPTRP